MSRAISKTSEVAKVAQKSFSESVERINMQMLVSWSINYKFQLQTYK